MRWWLLVMVACSSSNDPWCKPPSHTTYSCQPIPTGTTVDCIGGPKWTRIGAPTDASFQDDPDTIFPENCHAEIPDCSPFYKGSPRGFTCESGSWGELL
jgi:hypothetical protein